MRRLDKRPTGEQNARETFMPYLWSPPKMAWMLAQGSRGTLHWGLLKSEMIFRSRKIADRYVLEGRVN